MERDADVIVVGGGLNGPLLALALASAGMSSVVLDARAATELRGAAFDGRAYALALASRRMLEALGLWAKVSEEAQAINEIKISDGRAGEGAGPWSVHFDHREIEDGPMGHFLEDRFLRAALLDAVTTSNLISYRPETRVAAQQAEAAGVQVALAGGGVVRGRLLVGCDGRASGTAARAGIRRRGWPYRQKSLVCAVNHERPHHGIAHQFFMPQGPLAILPLPGHRSSIVWTEDVARADAIEALDDDAYLAALRPCFGDFLGDISLTGARYTYPLHLSLAERFVAERVALVGDAAHGIHPLAGQGLNLGFRDVAALAEVLADGRRRGQDPGVADLLEAYQRWRRFDTTLLAAATDGLNRLFSSDVSLMRVARGLGMAAVNSVPALRRGFIREAAGLSGDLPRLLRGEPI